MIDPVIDGFLDATANEPISDVEEPDALSKFLEDSALAGAVGGRRAHGFVENFRASSQDVDARFQKITSAPRPLLPTWDAISAARKAAADEWAEEIGDDALAKAAATDAGARRRLNLKQWMRMELASGGSVDELVKHARRHDAETANLLAEIAGELEA